MYRLATASPGHREHVALQRQPFASAWPRCHIAILHSIHLEGFTTCAKHGPSGHKTPRVGLYRFATAFPGHREHVALQRQPFASAWPCRHILHLEGFKTCAKHGPSRHKIRLWAFTALPLPSQVTAHSLPCSGSPLPAPGHVAILPVEGFKTCAKHRTSRHKTRLSAFTALPLPSQVTAHTLTCSGSPVPVPGHVAIIHVPPCHCFPRSPRTRCPAAAALCHIAILHSIHLEGFTTCAKHGPSVGLYRFATAFPGHRTHGALQRQPFASAWPCRHTPFRGFQNAREARPITTQNPSVGLYRFATAFPGHRTHVALQRQPFASARPCRHTPFRGFQNVREARPITTQNPSVGLYRVATAFPSHREHVALQRQPFASAWPCRHTPFRGFQNVREARPITTQNPSVGLYRFATAFPGHRTHVALQRQPCQCLTMSP